MNRAILLLIAIATVATISARPQIVAHRGFHQEGDAACNSTEALRRAQEAGFDYITTDNPTLTRKIINEKYK